MRVFACVATVLAGPALAQDCPQTFADVVRGVTVDYADGARSAFRLDLGSGEVSEDWTPADGTGVRTILGHGLHLLRVEDIVKVDPPTAGASYAYDSPPPPVEKPGQTWDIGYRMTDIFVGTVEGRYAGTVGPMGEIRIGDCSYKGHGVSLALREPGFTNYLQVDYIPALGLSVLRGYGSSLADIAVATPVAIRVTKP
jgi:hypothetical protein